MQDLTVTMKLKPAEKYDLLDAANNYKNGIIYFLKSGLTGEFSPYPYYISVDTDKVELNQYFKCKQIYVPVRYFDECSITINNNN